MLLCYYTSRERSVCVCADVDRERAPARTHCTTWDVCASRARARPENMCVCVLYNRSNVHFAARDLRAIVLGWPADRALCDRVHEMRKFFFCPFTKRSEAEERA